MNSYVTGAAPTDGAIGSVATFAGITDVTFLPPSYLLFADSQYIREWDLSSNSVSTIAGTYNPSPAVVDGLPPNATLQSTGGLAVSFDHSVVYFIETIDKSVRQLTLSTLSPTVVPTTVPSQIPTTSSTKENELSTLTALSSLTSYPVSNKVRGVFSGPTFSGAIDYTNNALYVAAAGFPSTGAGVVFGSSSGLAGYVDGAAVGVALFNSPNNAVVDSSGRYVYITDSGNHVIRVIDMGVLGSSCKLDPTLMPHHLYMPAC
jgi:hypothetical protein